MTINLEDYNKYRESMIQALMRYSHFKPAKLDRWLAEDVFHDAFFTFKDLIEGKNLTFNDFNVKESFIWRVNRFTYLTMISSDNSKYNRGVPRYSYVEDIVGLQIEDIQEEEEPLENFTKQGKSYISYMSGKILTSIINSKHRAYYKMYIRGFTMNQIAKKHSLNVRSLEQQIHRINKGLESKFGFKISKREKKK